MPALVTLLIFGMTHAYLQTLPFTICPLLK